MPRSILLGRPWPAAGEPLFTDEDTNWALAHAEYKAQIDAERCNLCGLPRSLCRDPANQFAFEAEFEQCHATYALVSRQEQAKGPEIAQRAMAWSARLKPPQT